MALKIMVIGSIFVIGEEVSARLRNPRMISFLEVDALDESGNVVYLPSGEKRVNTLIKMGVLPGFPAEIPIGNNYTYDVNHSDNATIELYKVVTSQQPQVIRPAILRPQGNFRGN